MSKDLKILRKDCHKYLVKPKNIHMYSQKPIFNITFMAMNNDYKKIDKVKKTKSIIQNILKKNLPQIRFPIVPVGTNKAASLPNISQTFSWRAVRIRIVF